jgi:hypothetical protein
VEREAAVGEPGGRFGMPRHAPAVPVPLEMEMHLHQLIEYLGFQLHSEGMSRVQSRVFDWCVMGTELVEPLQKLINELEAARLHVEIPMESPSGARELLIRTMYPSMSGAELSGRATLYLRTAPPESARAVMRADGLWDDTSDGGSPRPGDSPRMMHEMGIFRTPSPRRGSPELTPAGYGSDLGVSDEYTPMFSEGDYQF